MILNRPATNLRPPTAAAPEASQYGVKVARAVTRYAHQFRAMRDGGSVPGHVIDARDKRVLMMAGLITHAGQHRERIALTAEGGLLANQIAEGGRVYATETITFETEEFLHVPAGREGTVAQLTGLDDVDLIIEWDSGYVTGVNSGSVAPVPPLAR